MSRKRSGSGEAKVKYVQLEPGAFLADGAFQAMTAAERGVYWTILLYLYCHGGRWKLDEGRIEKLCNVGEGQFKEVYQNVLGKFTVRRGVLTHKRVTAELTKAQERRRQAVIAARARWSAESESDAGAEGRHCQAKRNESEEEKGNSNTNTSTNSNSSLSSVSSSVSGSRAAPKENPWATDPLATATIDVRIPAARFYNQLCMKLLARTTSDRTCFRNVTNWLIEQILDGRFTVEIFDRVMDYAKEAKGGRNPAAVFMTLVKKELGYGRERGMRV